MSMNAKNGMCERCLSCAGHFQQCEGDGQSHHHGCVHTVDGDLIFLCDACAEIEAKRWQAKRNGKTITEVYADSRRR